MALVGIAAAIGGLGRGGAAADQRQGASDAMFAAIGAGADAVIILEAPGRVFRADARLKRQRADQRCGADMDVAHQGAGEGP